MLVNPNPCAQCGGSLERRNPRAKYCFPCSDVRTKESLRRSRQRNPLSKWALRAHRMVAGAIKAGLLPRPETHKCADCGWGAQCYDHRDYNKPLEVDPVCYSCNVHRGSAIPHVADVSGSVNTNTKESQAVAI